MKSVTGCADRLLRPLEVLMAYVAGVLVLVLMVLGVVEVIGRRSRGRGATGSPAGVWE